MKFKHFLVIIFALTFAANIFADEPALKRINSPVAITDQGIHAMNPRWSPDGEKIAFTEAKYAGIWVLNIKTKEYFQVTDEPGAGFGFRWSADGNMILARVSQYRNYRRLNAVKVFDLKNARSFQLSEFRTQMPSLPRWANGNNYVYLFSKNKLEIFSVKKGESVNPSAEQISSQKPLIYWSDKNIHILRNGKSETIDLPIDAQILNGEISPDRSRIVFEKYGGNMFIYNFQTRTLTDLGEGNRPQWSPDGKVIIYMITKDDGYNFTQSDIFGINADGTGKVNLTKTSDLLEMNPCWSPDGKKIAFDELNSGMIYIMEVEKSKRKDNDKKIR